jgi:hypothetical protein
MKVKYRVTPIIKEGKQTISVLVIAESAKNRRVLGMAGGTWLESEVEECTPEEFASFLPHDTESVVQNLIPGNHVFDSAKGKWKISMSYPEFHKRLSDTSKTHFNGHEVEFLVDGVKWKGDSLEPRFIKNTWHFFPIGSSSRVGSSTRVTHREIYDLLQVNGKP